MSPDSWVEIPEGEFQAGITDAQREYIWSVLRDKAGYRKRSKPEQAAMDAVLDKFRRGEQATYEERKLFGHGAILTAHPIPARNVYLKRFYMARFPLTSRQYELLMQGRSLDQISAAWEEAEKQNLSGKLVYARCTAVVASSKPVVQICNQYGFRLPTGDEWEKAARGTDGRLYPWGNEWDEKRGFFYYGQKVQKQCAGGKTPVDAYPNGVSPYGVWSMAGGLPELVSVQPAPYLHWTEEIQGQQIWIAKKGNHPKDSSPETAWIDHIVAKNGIGDWVTFRPALDEWPIQQWRGIDTKR